MTTTPPPETTALDAALDEAIAAVTEVAAFEPRARLDLRATLEGSDPRGSNRPRRAPRLAFVATSALVAAVAVIGFGWFLNGATPGTTFDRGMARPGAATPVERSTRAGPTTPADPIAARPAVTSPVSPLVRIAPHATNITRPVAHDRPAMRAEPTPNRLAAFVRAIQQLPPEVWDRLDSAGPPAVAPIHLREVAPIAPIAVDPLPDTAWPETDGPTATTSPGGR